ncbi:MAG: hypothetical protein HYY85_20465 [Deltaproteobacteria bacterium]|nr:hypothetical protein [Deltaproteobacteria bacterium]
MGEFLQSYGIWIVLIAAMLLMHGRGMGCGGHRHGEGHGHGDRREPPRDPEGKPEASEGTAAKAGGPARSRGSCH